MNSPVHGLGNVTAADLVNRAAPATAVRGSFEAVISDRGVDVAAAAKAAIAAAPEPARIESTSVAESVAQAKASQDTAASEPVAQSSGQSAIAMSGSHTLEQSPPRGPTTLVGVRRCRHKKPSPVAGCWMLSVKGNQNMKTTIIPTILFSCLALGNAQVVDGASEPLITAGGEEGQAITDRSYRQEARSSVIGRSTAQQRQRPNFTAQQRQRPDFTVQQRQRPAITKKKIQQLELARFLGVEDRYDAEIIVPRSAQNIAIVALMTQMNQLVDQMSGEEEDWNPAILYTDLDYWEAAEITNRLTALGIPYKLTQDATAITVPDDQVRDLRLSLAGDGFPKSGTIGYEYRKAAALAAGFREARGDVTVTMDSDLLVMPEESLFAD